MTLNLLAAIEALNCENVIFPLVYSINCSLSLNYNQRSSSLNEQNYLSYNDEITFYLTSGFLISLS